MQAGASQDIYHDDTLTIKEIYVKSGDTVKIGDRLVAYDTTLAGLEQEMKQMEIQGIELNIQNQKAELEQLKNAKIVSSVERSQDELRKMTAKGTRPGIIRTADARKMKGKIRILPKILSSRRHQKIRKDRKNHQSGNRFRKN